MAEPTVAAQPDPPLSTLLAEATQRLVRGVDALPDEAYAEPSGLPGWTRGHVVAHLTLNAEGVGGAVRGILEGRRVTVYPSDEARDAGVAELGGASPTVLRDRLLAACTELSEAIEALPDDQGATTIERVPGGRVFTAASVPAQRLREVEVHHVDLRAGYAPADWPPAFAVLLIESSLQRGPLTDSCTLHADDLGRTWIVGDGGHVVHGAATDLAWWLAGRGTGSGVTSEGGTLPQVGAW